MSAFFYALSLTMGYKDVVCILPHFTQLTQPFDLKYLELIIKNYSLFSTRVLGLTVFGAMAR
ncbi:MAG: hypothetical protein HCA25_24500 [Dolichospermum sp. DET50]|nr:hypothetical protein [Dolichospermum sp. DET50]